MSMIDRKKGGRRMKKCIVILLSILLVSLSFTPSVSADRHHRNARHHTHHRHGGWEGVGIILGTSLLLNFLNHHQRCYTGFEPRPWTRETRMMSRGHWEEICQAPAYKRIWNPGHYNRYGTWIPGKWQLVKIRDRYCTRVWVR